jgi:hypothetical protein
MMKALLDKLGYKAGTPALAWQVPAALREQLAALTLGSDPTFRIAFVHSRADLAQAANEVAASYRQGGHLWLAYPKKSGAIASDLTRDHGWEPIAALGLLAVTQVAIDKDWSALRFRHRGEIKVLKRRSEQG